jgi:DASH complex subunit DAD3
MSAFAASDDPDALDYSYTEADHTTTTPPIGPPEQSMNSPEASHGRSRSNNPLLGDDNPLVSELEQEVLDEYSRLLRNVNQVRRQSSRSSPPQAALRPSPLSLPRRVFSTEANYFAYFSSLKKLAI